MAPKLTHLLIAFVIFFSIQSFKGQARTLKSERQQSFSSFLQKLEGVQKGQTVEGLIELKQYLKKFGYFPNDDNHIMTSDFDDNLESALKTYQKYFHLNITGNLDSATIKQMMIPRCGMPDIIPNNTKSKHNKFHMVAHLAHAFYPRDGRLHYDADENWSTDPAMDQTDLESVSVHEIGHLLGLRHSTDHPEAIMFPSIPPGTKKRDLAQDDIDGINALYAN